MNAMPQTRAALLEAAQRHYQPSSAAGAQPREPRALRIMPRLRPLTIGGGATALAATVAGVVVVLSAGGAPSAAQALPILGTPAVHVSDRAVARELHDLAGSSGWTVHTFVGADGGAGYVEESADESRTCVFYTPPQPTDPAITTVPAGGTPTPTGYCAPTADLMATGATATWNWNAGDYDYYAVVPTGGSLTLTDDGTTTSIQVDSAGIASGVVHDNATITLTVGTSTQARQLGPAASPTSTPPSGATG